MQSTYSWMGSRIHLVIEDEVAEAYNRAQDAFFQAQKNHKETHGTDWNPTEPLLIDWTEEETKAWNGVADVINALCDLSGSLDIPEEEMTSDYLVKV